MFHMVTKCDAVELYEFFEWLQFVHRCSRFDIGGDHWALSNQRAVLFVACFTHCVSCAQCVCGLCTNKLLLDKYSWNDQIINECGRIIVLKDTCLRTHDINSLLNGETTYKVGKHLAAASFFSTAKV